MKLYYRLYCRACKWYNVNGTKDDDTLRLSAFALLSALPTLNIISIFGFVGILIKHTYGSKWTALIIFSLIYIPNLIIISRSKSIFLRNEYELLGDQKKKQVNRIFYSYLFISVIFLLSVFILVAFYKHKFGNYDHKS